MKGLREFLRHLLVWWLPGLAILTVLVCGLVFWLLASQAGSRLLLTATAGQLDGQALGVRGSILRGLEVDRLDMNVGQTRIGIRALRVNVHWRALGKRLLHVRAISAGSVEIALTSNATTPADAGADQPFALPSLPVNLAVDRLTLGEFHLLRDGRSLPVDVDDLSATFAAGNGGAQLRIANVRVGHAVGQVQVSGQAELRGLAAPWPFSARLDATARGSGPDSPLCLADRQSGRLVSAAKPRAQAPKRPDAAVNAASGSAGPAAPACQIVLRADAAGSLEGIQVKLEGAGAGFALDVVADLAPRTPGVLRSARADARLPDDATLSARLDVQTAAGRPNRGRIVGTIGAHGLNLSPWLGAALPSAVVSANAQLSAELDNLSQLRQAAIDLRFEEGARWNKQPLAGTVKARMDTAESAAADLLAGLRLHGLDVDLTLGENRVRAQGEIGAGQGALTLDARAPQLSAFWPGVPGGADLKGTLSGTLAVHLGAFAASYTPDAPRPGVLGQSQARAAITFTGGWGKGPAGQAGATLTGWRGVFLRLTADSAGFTVSAERPVALSYLPSAAAPQWRWQVGQTVLGVTLPGKEKLTLAHKGSRGDATRWESAGQADNLVITAAMADQVIAAVDPDAAARMQRGPKRVNAAVPAGRRRIALDAWWDLTFDGRLAGRARIARRDGDLLIPGDPPVPLGVKTLVLDLTATPASASASRLDARLDLTTDKMGKVAGSAAAVLAVDAKGGMALDPRQPIRAKLDADMTDLAWVGLFVGDSMEIGGRVKANLDAQGTLAGKWSARGAIHGDKLRVVRIDDGVRLIDGALSARLDDDKLVLDSLRFPASLRVMPAEWRTKEWIATNPEAKDGYAEATGQWNLIDGGGKLRLTLHRFPALQRSDRYAMVSGAVDLNVAMPRIDIVGDLKADAGWFSLEILQGVPSLDDDVKVRRAGDAVDAATRLQTRMNLKFDMGPRFYITGMGLDAGLLGAIQIQLDDGRLSGMGALRTRGGGIEAYGQKLRLRRGTLTFQGRLDNPLLDIEALRTGEQVEAGVKVAGTAQRPRIDLVSYPDVSDVEKLSWLLLGRGPDESGSDAALLLSVGTALLGGGQPFYKQFGLDDVGVRTGNLGSSGSILPDRTVAGDVNRDSDSQLATQFLVAGKSFANGITLSVEQALAGSDTVGRASYRLARGLSLDLKGGSVNGIALVYRAFFDD